MITLVTGASGHIGSNLVRALLDAGRQVRALVHDRDSPGLDGLALEKVRGDVLDVPSLERAVTGVEVVFHLAAKITIGNDDPRTVRAINVGGVRNLVKACLGSRVRRFVHFSSIHAFSADPIDQVIDETRPLAGGPGTPLYDITKSEGERELSAGVALGLDAVVVNPTAVLGRHDYGPSRMGEVLLDLYHRRLPALIEGGFNWVDVRDVVAGALAAERVGRRGERYLLSGEWRSVMDLARIVEAVTGARAPRVVTPMWLARLSAPIAVTFNRITGTRPLFTPDSLAALRRHRLISHEKAARELGYRSRPLVETVTDAFDSFRSTGKLEKAA
jgi:dihydroflavonol-4-reductase